MKPIRAFLTSDQIEDLATRSNFRYGKSMVDDGDITLVSQNTYNFVADVKHGLGQKRTVRLESTPKGFKWKCTCTNKKNYFCNHCVAVGLFASSNIK